MPHPIVATEPNDTEQTETIDSSWSLAIHGGAGGTPAKWSPEKRQARRAGLTKALDIGTGILSRGGTSLDAVEAVIMSLEDDSNFNAGRGAVLTQAGHAELDASIMDGRTAGCGAIAGVRTVKNPIATARLVMTQTPHVLLAGVGADDFAKSQNVALVDPDYFLSRNDAFGIGFDSNEMHFGTVGCVARDTAGNLAAGTSTGGTTQKLPGRVGDSPIIGAGTFADNLTCAVSGTGIGEEYIRHAVAHDIAARMRDNGTSIHDAMDHIMTRVLKPDTGGLIGVDRDGTIVMQHNTPAMSCACADSTGRRDVFLELDNDRFASHDDTTDAPAVKTQIETITKLIEQQASDWNRGDIDAFMDAYWNDERLTFSSGGDVMRGWQATNQRYKQRYPDVAAMGQVSFSQLEFLPLDDNAMQVLGRWDLERDADPVGGRFTLIFRRHSGQWKIVHDHTSVKKPTE